MSQLQGQAAAEPYRDLVQRIDRPPVSPEETALQIDCMLAFVDESWSNIAVAQRLDQLFYLVPQRNRKAMAAFSSAARAARNSGSVALIKSKINRLHAALKAAS